MCSYYLMVILRYRHFSQIKIGFELPITAASPTGFGTSSLCTIHICVYIRYIYYELYKHIQTLQPHRNPCQHNDSPPYPLITPLLLPFVGTCTMHPIYSTTNEAPVSHGCKSIYDIIRTQLRTFPTKVRFPNHVTEDCEAYRIPTCDDPGEQKLCTKFRKTFKWA